MKPTPTFRRLKRWLLAGSILPASMLSGCHHTCHAPNHTCFDPCANIVPGSLPAPNGAFVRQHQIVQTNKAEQDDFVVYLNEWYMGGRDLGPFGEYHIVQMAQRMPFTPYPIIVDVCPDPELNEHRRRVVIEKLAMAGAQDAPMRVRLGRPEAEGLFGAESFRVYNGLLFNTGQGGGNANGFGGIGGGFGGAGTGGFGGFMGGFPGY